MHEIQLKMQAEKYQWHCPPFKIFHSHAASGDSSWEKIILMTLPTVRMSQMPNWYRQLPNTEYYLDICIYDIQTHIDTHTHI